MYTRHKEVPVFEYRNGKLDAAIYNHAKVALTRFGPELRLKLPGLKTLELILQQDAWILVDRAFNDVPVAAWSRFERLDHNALNQPVNCQIRLYHANAGLVLKQVLVAMTQTIDNRLHDEARSHVVIEISTDQQ